LPAVYAAMLSGAIPIHEPFKGGFSIPRKAGEASLPSSRPCFQLSTSSYFISIVTDEP